MGLRCTFNGDPHIGDVQCYARGSAVALFIAYASVLVNVVRMCNYLVGDVSYTMAERKEAVGLAKVVGLAHHARSDVFESLCGT